MDKLINLLEAELLDEAEKLEGKENLTNQDVPRINIIGSLASGIHGLKELKKSGRTPMAKHAASWKDDISEELESAAEKYEQYKKMGDPVMLDFARQELEHANYYLNHAKMSADEKMREKLPEYQATYEALEKQLKEPHGNEKLPVL